MKQKNSFLRILIVVLGQFLALSAQSQSTYPIRTDTLRVYGTGPNGATLKLESASKGILGPLVNTGNGITVFRLLVPNDIPFLDASKITTGVFDAARIPGLDASKIISGVLDPARVPSAPAAGATGQVQFNNAGAFGASPNLFWDMVNGRLGIGTAAPATPLQVVGNATIGGTTTGQPATAANQYITRQQMTDSINARNPVIPDLQQVTVQNSTTNRVLRTTGTISGAGWTGTALELSHNGGTSFIRSAERPSFTPAELQISASRVFQSRTMFNGASDDGVSAVSATGLVKSVDGGFATIAGTVQGDLQASTASGGSVGLGTFTNHPLFFKTNNVERGRIHPAGRLLWGGAPDDGTTLAQFSGNVMGAPAIEPYHFITRQQMTDSLNARGGGGASDLQATLVAGNTATNNITLGAAANTTQYSYFLQRNIGSVDYTSSRGIVNPSGSLASDEWRITNGTVASDKVLYLNHGSTAPSFSPNGGTTTYNMWHENNHPQGSAFNMTFTGTAVPASLVTNAAGHVTGVTVRSLTPADIGAAPASGSANYIHNSTLTQTANATINGSWRTMGGYVSVLKNGSNGYSATYLLQNAAADKWMNMQLTGDTDPGMAWWSTIGGVNQERMRLTATGELAIGTTAPESKLEVRGDILASQGPVGAGAGRLYLGYTSGGGLIRGESYNGTVWNTDQVTIDGSALVNNALTVTGNTSVTSFSPAFDPVIKTANFTVTAATPFTTFMINNGPATVDVTLPTASDVPGRIYFFKVNSNSNPVTIDGLTVNFSWAPSPNGPLCIMQSNGTNWIPLQGF